MNVPWFLNMFEYILHSEKDSQWKNIFWSIFVHCLIHISSLFEPVCAIVNTSLDSPWHGMAKKAPWLFDHGTCNQLKFMDVYGCLWMFMDVHGCLWMFMDVNGCLWMFMVLFAGDRLITDFFCPSFLQACSASFSMAFASNRSRFWLNCCAHLDCILIQPHKETSQNNDNHYGGTIDMFLFVLFLGENGINDMYYVYIYIWYVLRVYIHIHTCTLNHVTTNSNIHITYIRLQRL